MGSEEQVLELMLLLDEGLLEANKLEEKLDEYDHKLQVHIRLKGTVRKFLSELGAGGFEHFDVYLVAESERFDGDHERQRFSSQDQKQEPQPHSGASRQHHREFSQCIFYFF